MRDHTEDGMGFSGLVPDAKEKRETKDARNAEETIAKLRSALSGLVGVDGKDELDKMEAALRLVETEDVNIIKNLMLEKHFDWANWLIVRIMERKQYLSYAIFAAEQVLDIFENKYPDDKRPRLAIEAARKCLTNDSSAARAAAWAAGDAAKEKMQTKIINYGIKLLEPGK